MPINVSALTNAYAGSFMSLWDGIVMFIPNIIVAIVIFIAGWFVGAALGRIVTQVVHSLKLDSALKNTPVNDAVERAGFSLDIGAFLGGLVKWFFVIVFLVASLDVLGLNEVNAFLTSVVLAYLPQVIVAVLIILVGAVVAQLARDIVTGAAKAAGVHGSGFVGSVAKWAIWIFAILAALEQLQVATAFLQILFTGIVVAAALALGLAFGLGGQEAAARYIERVRNEIGNHKN